MNVFKIYWIVAVLLSCMITKYLIIIYQLANNFDYDQALQAFKPPSSVKLLLILIFIQNNIKKLNSRLSKGTLIYFRVQASMEIF